MVRVRILLHQYTQAFRDRAGPDCQPTVWGCYPSPRRLSGAVHPAPLRRLCAPLCVMTLRFNIYLWLYPLTRVAVAISKAGGKACGTIRYTQSEELEEALTWMDEQLGGAPGSTS